MRRVFGAGLLALIGLTGTAFAADLSAPLPTTKAPIPASTINWSGFYVGVNAGGGWYGGNGFVGGGNVESLVPATSLINVPSTASRTAAGFTAGGLAGYNFQFGSFVLGAETDFNDFNSRSDRSGSTSILCCETFVPEPIVPPSVVPTDLPSRQTPPVPSFFPPGIHPGFFHFPVFVPVYATETLSHASRSQLDWFGTARVRFGYVPTPRLLVYGTGGLAYGEVQGNLAGAMSSRALSPRGTGKGAIRT
jgi:outer membrane immunogenic protein